MHKMQQAIILCHFNQKYTISDRAPAASLVKPLDLALDPEAEAEAALDLVIVNLRRVEAVAALVLAARSCFT